VRDNGSNIAAAALATLVALAAPAVADSVTVAVRTADGDALSGAAVVLRPLDAAAAAPAAAPTAAGPATMAQQNQEFTPGVLTVSRGGAVSFPNLDAVQHHVYSFSAARTFELPLYKGETPPPVAFDQAGVVTLGCNIHDHMRGFIVVADSPFHGVTDDAGRIELDVPAGEYQLVLWHARQRETPAAESIAVSGPLTLDRRLDVRPPPKPVVKGLKAWVAE